VKDGFWRRALICLHRCRYRGDYGMQRWVGRGVIADNLINVGLAIGKQSAK
jgi:hypothetical protein